MRGSMRSCAARAHEFFYATDVPVERHELKLTLLGDLVAHAADPDEMIIFIDGDAFPSPRSCRSCGRSSSATPWSRCAATRTTATASRTRPSAPRPRGSGASCPATGAAGTPGSTRRARRSRTWVATSSACSRTPGSSGIRCCAPTRSTRTRSSSGSTRTSCTTTEAASASPPEAGCGGRRSRTGSTRRCAGGWPRGSPAKGLAGRVRKMINPVRRYRQALGEELARVNEQVFELIQRDETFYLQLIEPERGGELAAIKAPVLLDDAKELSPTRLSGSAVPRCRRGGQGGEDPQPVLRARERIHGVLGMGHQPHDVPPLVHHARRCPAPSRSGSGPARSEARRRREPRSRRADRAGRSTARTRA